MADRTGHESRQSCCHYDFCCCHVNIWHRLLIKKRLLSHLLPHDYRQPTWHVDPGTRVLLLAYNLAPDKHLPCCQHFSNNHVTERLLSRPQTNYGTIPQSTGILVKAEPVR
jgi:hypothetical protein